MELFSFPISLSSGQEGWVTPQPDSDQFVLEIENGKRTREVLSWAELKTRLPHAADFIADVLAHALKSNA